MGSKGLYRRRKFLMHYRDNAIKLEEVYENFGNHRKTKDINNLSSL